MGAQSQSVSVNRTGEAFVVRAPGFTFIKGEPLARLKDGHTVRVELAVMILAKSGGPRIAETRQTLLLSYDLWEERFAVSLPGTPPRSAAYLTSSAAEAWCLDQVTVPVAALLSIGREAPFWVRLEYHILDGELAPADNGTAGDTLQGIIDALSRRRKSQEWTHTIEAGPFRLPQ
jgi:hypothetical protein